MYRPVVVVLVLVAVAFSGCSKKGGEPSEDVPIGTEPKSTISKNESIDTSLKDKGEIRGYVRDTANQSLAGANVALFETPYFDQSDLNGHFEITNITPGTYSLRADRAFHRSIQQTVVVKPSRVLDLEIKLSPIVNLTDDQAKHKHDYWGAEPKLTILERDVETTPENYCVGATVLGSGTWGCGLRYVEDTRISESHVYFESPPDMTKRPNIVFPGTGKLTLQVTVTGQVQAPLDVFVTMPVVGAAPKRVNILTVEGPDQTGSVDVGAENEDPPHFRTSGWSFELLAHPAPAGPLGLTAISGTMHWKVVIERSARPLPLDNPHVNYWGSLTNETLVDSLCEFFVAAPAHVWSRDPDANCENWYVSSKGDEDQYLKPEGNKTVRPSAGRMNITLDWFNYLGVPYTLGIQYLDATWTPGGERFIRPPAPVVDEDGHRKWSFELRPDQCDSPYAKVSRWRFQIYMIDPTTGREEVAGNATMFFGDFTYKVDVFKQP